MAIHFFEESIKSRLSQKRKLSALLQDMITEYRDARSRSISYVFCDDAYLLEKNRQFLNHDTLTDIITFDLSENDSELTAEIYVSIERVRDNAEKFSVPYNNELHRVIFHGMLHLCGFKDKSAKDKTEMREMEDLYLNKYFG